MKDHTIGISDPPTPDPLADLLRTRSSGCVLLLLLSISLLWGTTAIARTIIVDPMGEGTPCTVQEAIDIADAAGTEIILRDPWIYTGPGNREISTRGKAVTIRSRSGDPSRCVIDCELRGRAFCFTSGEGHGTVIRGIGIRNGRSLDQGGGILCDSASSPRIERCEITGSRANQGGGIWCGHGSNPVIVDCRIRANRARGSGGGGIYVVDASPHVVRGSIESNESSDGSGAGIHARRSAIAIDSCMIRGNDAFLHGGGVWIEGVPGTSGPDTLGRERSARIQGCLIAGNSVRESGGGGIGSSGARPRIARCTIAANTAPIYGGGVFAIGQGAAVVLEECIVWGNCAPVGEQLYAGPGASMTVRCTVIDPSETDGMISLGPGNRAVDPMFCETALCTIAPATNGDYHLRWDSPVVSGQSFCGVIGAFRQPCPSAPMDAGASANIPQPGLPMIRRVTPNPTSGRVRIEAVIPRGYGGDAIGIVIHDIAGRAVRRLDGDLVPAKPGEYAVVWDGLDDQGRPVPSGAYYCFLKPGDGLASTYRLVVVR
jgi:hypothetical protein